VISSSKGKSPLKRTMTRVAAAVLLSLGLAAPAVPQAAPSAERTMNIAYRINWGVISVGNISMDLRATRVGYSVAARTNMSRTLQDLAPRAAASANYTARASGRIGATGLVPGTYSHSGGRKGRVVNVNFNTAVVGVSVNPAFGSMGEPPASAAQRREAMDALSAMSSLILAGNDTPCARTLRIFDGKARYNLAMSAGGTERVQTPAFTGNAIRCNTRYQRIAGFDADDGPLFRGALTIWVARQANGLYAPVRIRGESSVGMVTIDATRLTAAGTP
jgi:hypothetical protein